MWQTPDLTQLVPSCPSAIQQLIRDATRVDYSGRPLFAAVAKTLVGLDGVNAVDTQPEPSADVLDEPQSSTTDPAAMGASSPALLSSSSSSLNRHKRHSVQGVELSVVDSASSLRDHGEDQEYKERDLHDAESMEDVEDDTTTSSERPSRIQKILLAVGVSQDLTNACAARFRKYHLTFPDASLEREFCQEHLQSEAHYRSGKCVFYTLAIAYFAFAIGVRTRSTLAP